MAANTKSRKDNGEGTIRQRSDGRWEWRRVCKEDNQGKPVCRYGATRAEVLKKKREYMSNLYKYKQEPQKTTVADLAQFWMHTYKFPNLRGNSRDRMETTFEKHIKPELGCLIASKVSCDDIQVLINQKAQEVSYSYLKKIYQFLNGFFNYMKTRQIVMVNPCEGVILPRESNMVIKTKETAYLTEAEVQRLYDFNERIRSRDNHFYKYTPTYVFLLNTGLRCAEGLALEWEDIDLENRICHVRRNLTLCKQRDQDWNAGKRQKLIGETKTSSGKRDIPLNERAMDALYQIKDYNQRMGIQTTHVIAADTGDQITERSLLRSLDYVLGAIDAQHIGLHGLRHTFASTLLRKGVDVSVVSKLLGHKDITTTYNTYIHIIDAQKRAAMDAIPSI